MDQPQQKLTLGTVVNNTTRLITELQKNIFILQDEITGRDNIINELRAENEKLKEKEKKK